MIEFIGEHPLVLVAWVPTFITGLAMGLPTFWDADHSPSRASMLFGALVMMLGALWFYLLGPIEVDDFSREALNTLTAVSAIMSCFFSLMLGEVTTAISGIIARTTGLLGNKET